MAERICAHCGVRYEPRRSDQRWCRKSCRTAHYRHYNPKTCSQPDCDRPNRARGLCSMHYNQTHLAERHRSKGDPETRRLNLRKRTAKRRALLRDPLAELIDHRAIGERDRWRCGICGRPIDRSLRFPEPLSASVDHIVPLSQGGTHTAANVRITHLRCNVTRSNRGGGEQLSIVG
jgi:hypothetical protein